MTYLPVSSGGLGGKPLRHALENCQARKTCGGEKRGALDGSWMGIGILPSSTRSDSRELHYAVVILSLCQIQLGLIGGAEREGSQKEKESGIECAKETAGRHQIRECL